MIRIDTIEILGFKTALHGMRNPKDSWEKADTVESLEHEAGVLIGENDWELAIKLASGGSVHGKFRRMLHATADILAPLYWWKEFDTYRFGVEKDSCSTMHTLHKRDLNLADFSKEHLFGTSESVLLNTIETINLYRKAYMNVVNKNDPIAKDYWWQMIQLLPSSYNQLRTVEISYEALHGMYEYRIDHKLDEWRDFCLWVEKLPYSELITGVVTNG